MEWLTDPNIWASLLTLTALEIVLGIDNLVFLAILANRLPEERRATARRLGLFLALFARLALLASISWMIGLTAPLFHLGEHPVSWRDLILIGGGLFLVYKGTREIHDKVEGDEEELNADTARAVSFAGVIAQIIVLDIIFSLDSVITAVGLVDEIWIMAVAIIIAVGIMLLASAPLTEFIHRHPTVKMLALSFLLLVGMTLIADGAGFHIPKGYIYAAMAFSVMVESLNLLAASRRKRRRPAAQRGPAE